MKAQFSNKVVCVLLLVIGGTAFADDQWKQFENDCLGHEALTSNKSTCLEDVEQLQLPVMLKRQFYLDVIWLYLRQHNTEEAAPYMQIYRDLPTPIDPLHLNHYRWLRAMGYYQLQQQQYAKAKQNFSDALSWAQASSDIHRLGKSYNDLAATQRASADYQSALDNALKSLKYKTLQKDNLGIAKTLGNAGDISRAMADYQNAINYYEQALSYLEEPGSATQAHLYETLAISYQQLEQWKTAHDYFEQAITLYQTFSYDKDLSRVYISFAGMLIAQGLLEQASEQLDNAQKRGYVENSPAFKLHWSNLMVQQGNYQSASKLAEEGLQYARENHAGELVMAFLDVLSQALFGEGKFAEANKMREQYYEHKIELIESKHTQRTRQLTAELELIENRKQLSTLEQVSHGQLKTITWLEYGVYLLLFLLVLGAINFFFILKRKQSERAILAQQVSHHKLLYNQLFQKKSEEGQKNTVNAEEKIKTQLVELMQYCFEVWQHSTGTGKVDFAENSKIWRVTIDEGRLRTRTLDRYLSVKSLPKVPRVQFVLQTGHFVLAYCKLSSAERTTLNEKISQLIATINSA